MKLLHHALPAGGGYAGTLTDGLQLYVSDGVEDKTGQQVDLTVAGNAPGTAAGIFGGSCNDFDAANTEAYQLTGGNLGILAEMAGVDRSYAMWINRDAVATSVGLLSKGTAAASYQFYVQSDGKLVLYIGYGYLVSVATIALSTWTHVGFSYTPGTATLWLNGVKLVSAKTRTVASDLVYMGRAFSPIRYYDGRVDQFCIWNRVLTDGEWAELYNGGAGADFQGSL